MATRHSITGSIPMHGNLSDYDTKQQAGKTLKKDKRPQEAISTIPLGERPVRTPSEQHEFRVKKIYVISITFKICMLIVDACALGFACESTPNIEIPGCSYDHRPGYVAFFIVVLSFFFCVMLFLMAYQLFHQLKEKAKVPQRVMDLVCIIMLIIICAVSLATYAMWFDNFLDPNYTKCVQKKYPQDHHCINPQNCHMIEDMRSMAIGALFWGALLLLFLILGAILLSCVIGKHLMESPEGQAFYRKMQEDSNLNMKQDGGLVASNTASTTKGVNNNCEYDDEELGYGGEGLVLLNLKKNGD